MTSVVAAALRDPWWRVVALLCALKALLHLALVQRYGYHGDELYFVECGRRLALGYVDHPPLIPWLARAADELGGGLLLLRLPAIVAGVGTLLCTALLVREWGGGTRAVTLALVSATVAPASLRLGGMLNIPVIEVFLCSLVALLVARALRRSGTWTWLWAGAVLGLAILAKHSSLLWAGALAAGVLATPARRALAQPWPWAGGLVALAVAAPNLAWQVQHDFATLTFIRTLRHEVLAEQGRALFVAGQLLYFHPLVVPVWVAGLVFAFREPGRAARPFALLFVIMFAALLGMGGKPYYLASAYPAVLAAGGVALERWFASRVVLYRVALASLAATGMGLATLTLPVLPLPVLDASIERLLGRVVPPIALTHDLHGMYGWEQHVAEVEHVFQELSPQDRDVTTVLAGNYSQASAINVLGSARTPLAVSGNMSYFLWGPGAGRGEVLIVYGQVVDRVRSHYGSCSERGRIRAPLARPWDTELPVYVCRDPDISLQDLWPRLQQYGHLPPSAGR